ncbi:tyrosine-type recombinase/integrase [Acetivibrio mesophilus]|uniref:Integrase n=1 Tax=Acetivibrio mesophilus TaxID=2487273 RepID=A0A4Q0I4E3_9FIRM|nr:tyrosine-type recombinase/integrase [Acetivibrio mesophilus]ODM27977.1 hypothetical protein A7W90_18185 [Clostridium sp. Bc-iso-3]RXE57782.1 integrase [Acetivibrio mesophilus]HHV28728.1 tyrosine-type recombinase/integrase [Clostridium sp.]
MYNNNKDISFEPGKYTILIKEYIKHLDATGYKTGTSYQYYMRDICRQLNQLDSNTDSVPNLTKELVEMIAMRRGNESSGTQMNRIGRLRRFACFMLQKGYSAYIYPSISIPKRNFEFKAFVFDRDQISSILKEADSIGYLPRSPKAELIYPAMIRILYCCGLRSSEVRMLKRSDVDLNTGVLYICKSKNDVSRYVPISESLRLYLLEYTQKMMFQSQDIWMFPSPRGGYLSAVALGHMCKKLFERAGIQVLATGRYPRVHDFRHSYIVHALDHMVKDKGMDIYAALPIISAYVGHSGIKDTEYYIHLSSFHYEQIISAGEEILGRSEDGDKV